MVMTEAKYDYEISVKDNRTGFELKQGVLGEAYQGDGFCALLTRMDRYRMGEIISELAWSMPWHIVSEDPVYEYPQDRVTAVLAALASDKHTEYGGEDGQWWIDQVWFARIKKFGKFAAPEEMYQRYLEEQRKVVDERDMLALKGPYVAKLKVTPRRDTEHQMTLGYGWDKEWELYVPYTAVLEYPDGPSEQLLYRSDLSHNNQQWVKGRTRKEILTIESMDHDTWEACVADCQAFADTNPMAPAEALRQQEESRKANA